MDSRDLDPQPIEPVPEPDLEPQPPIITPDPLQARLIPGEIAMLAVVAVIVLVGAWVILEFAGMVSETPDPSASPTATRGAGASPSPSRSPSPSTSSSPGASPSSSPTPIPTGGPGQTPAVTAPALAVTSGDDLAGRWRRIREAPIGGRTDAAVAWTGSELLVWGGFNGEARWGDGAAYDPAANTWRRLPKSPLSARMAPAHAWSGREFLVWGGFRGSDADDGAAYDPEANRWRALPSAPLMPGPAAGAWINGGFLVVTGAPSAALYDPETNAWTELAPPPLGAGELDVVVVTGRVFVVRPSTAPGEPTEIALLIRADRSWRKLADGPPASADAPAIAAEPFVLLGDLRFDTEARTWTQLDLGDCAYEPSSAADVGAALVVSATAALQASGPTCHPMPAVPARPEGGDRLDAAVAWTGRDWIAWSGAPAEGSSGPYDNDGVAFAPAP